jgi:hypothetical protein
MLVVLREKRKVNTCYSNGPHLLRGHSRRRRVVIIVVIVVVVIMVVVVADTIVFVIVPIITARGGHRTSLRGTCLAIRDANLSKNLCAGVHVFFSCW